MYDVATSWPSVTGVAYSPFLLGRHPGPVGLPGLRWFDRGRGIGAGLGHARSYVGYGMRSIDGDLSPDAPTIFELVDDSFGALSVIGRGLAPGARLGRGARFVARAAMTHFRGDIRGWLDIDREIGSAVAARVRRDRPAFAFAAFTGIDKTSHAAGHDGALVQRAMQIVDDTVAELRQDAERAGRWEETQLWIVSDHGHSPVSAHDDLAVHFRSLGFRVLTHPWTFGWGQDVAVMVSGNAMAHLYLELSRRERPFWPALRLRWEEAIADLLRRPSVDLVILPHSTTRTEIRGPGRGTAMLEHRNGRYSYRPEDGDPLGIGALEAVSSAEALEATWGSDYPDAVVQVAHLAGASRSGEVILSASRGWDFRGRYEPIAHVSSHGALHREHMLVPLLLNHRPARAPQRTVDIMPSALAALGVPIPAGLDGEQFVTHVDDLARVARW